jgi:hypothetical protein
MGLDDFADFASDFGDLATEAFDVASETLSDGFEYLSDGFDQLQEQVGSFAGDGGWFDTNFPGDITSVSSTFTDFDPTLGGAFTEVNGVFVSTADLQAESFSNFFSGAKEAFGIPTELGGSFGGDLLAKAQSFVPSFDTLAAQAQKAVTQQIVSTGIKAAAGAINSQVAQIPVVGGIATGIVNRTAGAVSNAVNQQVGGLPVTLPNASQLVGPGFANVPGIQLASLGNDIPLNLLKVPTGTVTVTGISDAALTGTVPATNTAPAASEIDRSAGNVGYITSFDPETQTYAVVNEQTGQPVTTGLTEQQALLQAQEQTFIDAGESPSGAVAATGPLATPPGGFTADQLNAITAAAGVDDGGGGTITDAQLFKQEAAQREASVTSALREQAQQQQTIRNQRQNRAQSSDWRVRLRLAPRSTYLYNDPDCGPVLWPLQNTDGVIFPYTPAIDLAYKANYNHYDLTHSNYRGYFYQNSNVDQINLRAQFTAQDTTEANYLLAAIHFFRSATKMFYGQDAQRGAPPPLVYISGYGDFQFAEHPLVIAQFNYNLPADVNYIRAQTATDVGTNLQPTSRQRQTVAGNPLSYAYQRLKSLGQGINRGALDTPFAPQGSLGVANPTYVPTKIEISLVLYPMQSRQQVSQQFSLKGFANGNLLKGGFW